MVRSVTTRPAVPADAADLVGVHVRTWRQAYAGIMPDEVLDGLDGRREEQVRRVRERLSQADPRFRTVVAVSPAAPGRAGHDPGRVLGFATFGPYRLEQGRADGAVDPSVGEVLAIYVDPPHQGRGAGRALMAEAVTALRTAGAGEVRLWVLEENAPSLRFYQRYGFVRDGERHLFRVHRPDGSPVDLPEVRLVLRGGGRAAAAERPRQSGGGRAAAAELGPRGRRHAATAGRTLVIMAVGHVREARPEDAGEIARIQLTTWRVGCRRVLPARALDDLDEAWLGLRWRVAVEAPPSPRHRVLVAVEQRDRSGPGELVGFVASGPADDQSAAPQEPDPPRPEDTAAITDLLVCPRWGRRGHGSRLLAASVDLWREDGFTTAVAWVYESDPATSRFLASAGWQPDGARRALDVDDRLVPQVRLHAGLDPAGPGG